MDYTLRDSHIDDFEEIFDIWKLSQDNSCARSLIDMEEYKPDMFKLFKNQNDNFKFYVADRKGEIVGYQSILPTENNPVLCHEQAVSSTYVKLGCGGQGVGVNLIKHACEEAKKTTINIIYGKVVASNTPAMNMVEKSGWCKVGLIPQTTKPPVFSAHYLYYYLV